jgi:hypothetical protein
MIACVAWWISVGRCMVHASAFAVITGGPVMSKGMDRKKETKKKPSKTKEEKKAAKKAKR